MPTRSRTRPARRAGPQPGAVTPMAQKPSPRHARTAALVAAATLSVLAAVPAHAHEPGADALPGTPGWRLGAAAAALAPHADARWPTAAWPGVLINGNAPRDQRDGLRLEHATLDLAARLDAGAARLGAHVAVGWHDREAAHTEAARLLAELPWRGGWLAATLGRDTVRMGAVIDGAGHFDRFSQPPLAKRAVLNEQWLDDGASLAWRPGEEDGLRAVEAGVWRGRAFPGGPDGSAVPTLHVHAGWGHVDLHVAAAHLQPEGRGAAAQSAGAVGHVHGSLDCRASLQQKVCFDGDVDVLGASVQWEPGGGDWTLALAGLGRRERGSLYSTSGDAAWRSTVAGGWAEVAWRPAANWTLALRAERLVPRNRLEGVGTTLLAREAGVAEAGAVERGTAAVLYDWGRQWQFALEAGQERFAGGRVSHVALRAIWRQPRWLGGSW